mgnify:CR=1 FL=1
MFYKFKLKNGKKLNTQYSPREISGSYCFDAVEKNGDSVVIDTGSVDFKSFEAIDG